MPYKPKRICPKCGKAVSGRCECQGSRRPQHQQKTSDRGYDWAWQKLTKQIKQERVLCEDCSDKGRVTVGVECHHLVKVKHDPTKRLDPDNVRLLCVPCHRARTAKGE